MEWVTTSTLLRGLRASDDDAAWQRLVERFRTPIIAFGRRLGLGPTDAEDVAQETLTAFLESYRSGGYDRERGRLSAWLFGIAYNQALRQRRRAARPEVTVPANPGSAGFWGEVPDERTATALWDEEWEQALLERCLDQARVEFEPATFRAFELVMRDERTAAEAATALGVSVKSVYNAKHRVLKRLRELRETLEVIDEG